MFAVIGQWSHALAAVLFAAVMIWIVRRPSGDRGSRALALACLATAIWAIAAAVAGFGSVWAQALELVRNLGWLGFLYVVWRQDESAGRTAQVAALYITMFALTGVQLGVAILPLLLPPDLGLADAIFMAANALHMMALIGALVLVHNLYLAATPDARAALRLPLAGLAICWFYDLNLYSMSYLAGDWTRELFALRGGVVAAIAPIFGLAALKTQNWSIRLSRSMTFQSLGLAALSGYVIVIVMITAALNLLGGDQARLAQILFAMGATLGALLLLPSKRFRAWFRVKIAKHLFQHRYDYRAEWLRFTDTLGRPGEDATPLKVRVVQAIADIVESPGGLLLVPEAGGTLVVQGQWKWAADAPSALPLGQEAMAWLARTGRIVELDHYRGDETPDEEEARAVPQWMVQQSEAWVVVPLGHFDRLAGLVLLARPEVSRTLDWEDYDLLRVAGRQVASYLSEAQSQEALSDGERFDEFNRRFAFIMHDIKNLVSQLSLVTRNAERHADNPEFRADMIATLKNSTGRMNDMLARLSQHNKGRADAPRAIAAGPLAESVAAAKRAGHPVVVGGEIGLSVTADPARLEQALAHLVQNAIDASPTSEPVSILIGRKDQEAVIAIVDKGCGMAAGFVRDQLFRPFASTKDGGFGIGAYEARSLIASMGGRLEVESREGHGSRFSILLPLALDPAMSIEPAKALAA